MKRFAALLFVVVFGFLSTSAKSAEPDDFAGADVEARVLVMGGAQMLVRSDGEFAIHGERDRRFHTNVRCEDQLPNHGRFSPADTALIRQAVHLIWLQRDARIRKIAETPLDWGYPSDRFTVTVPTPGGSVAVEWVFGSGSGTGNDDSGKAIDAAIRAVLPKMLRDIPCG